MIPYGRQDISEKDIEAVISVLRSDYLTQGPVVPEFEKNVAEFCSVKYGIAVSSATAALHIACLSLGIEKDDIVWTSPISFVASANCAIYCGAKVDFVDIDGKTYNMSIAALKAKLEKAMLEGRLPFIWPGNHVKWKPFTSLAYSMGLKLLKMPHMVLEVNTKVNL
jgi:dTDP-4-amino-4,6-dideoxygalactose transaminase